MVYRTQPIALTLSRLLIASALLLCLGLAFWQSVAWFINRIWLSPEEAVSALLFLFLLIYFVLDNLYHRRQFFPLPLYTLSALVFVYGTTLVYLPNLISAAFALAIFGFALFWMSFGRIPGIDFWALAALSLPVVPSLQFYLGLPARLISASLTVPLLQLNGFQVERQGTYLVWQGQLLQFDAPCSGVTMLWAGMLLTLLLCFWHQLSFGKMLLAILAGMFVVLIGNVIRASALFYLELGILQNTVDFPIDNEALHEAIGVVVFLLIACALLYISHRLKHWPVNKKVFL